jgi:spore germination cell wall hydrolase CwlJ-like protein
MMRQCGAAAAVVLVAWTGMGLIAHRGAEQRDAALWAERAAAFRTYELAEAGPAARLQLAAYPSAKGLRGRAQGMLAADALDRQAMTVSASLRGAFGAAPPVTSNPKVETGVAAGGRAANARAREQRCLAEAIYYEARGETYQGQLAVAEVVTNRVTSRHWPDTYCGVVYEGHTRATGCQFSFTCDGSMNRRPKGPAWRQANTIAAQVLMGLARPITHSATHYHTTGVSPYWRHGLVETGRVGAHIFYRLPTAAEKATMAHYKTRRRSAGPLDETPAGSIQTADVMAQDVTVETADAPAAAPDPQAASPAPAPAADAPVVTAPAPTPAAPPAAADVTDRGA